VHRHGKSPSGNDIPFLNAPRQAGLGEKGVAAHIGRLGAIAKTEPEIKDAVEEYLETIASVSPQPTMPEQRQ
jgi:hypothetical protein